MKEMSGMVAEWDLVLDAGAGLKPYKRFFDHAKYESTDLQGDHDFLCSLETIPKPDGTYDFVINNQVLEHVVDPAKVISEFYRLLVPGGMLLMTVPQGYGVHSDNNYFNFLKNGIALLLEKAGFKRYSIEPLGGIHRLIGKLFYLLPWYIFRQYLVYKGYHSYRLTWKAVLLSPFFLLSIPFCMFLFPLFFMAIDKLDTNKDWTITYGVIAVK